MTLRYGSTPVHELDLYTGPGPLVVAIHPGGFVAGDKGGPGLHAEYARILSAQGYMVASVNYRLAVAGAPTWPAAVEDVEGAVAYVRQAFAYAGPVALLGVSAGGLLALMAGFRGRIQGHACTVALAAPYDLAALRSDAPYPWSELELFLGRAPMTTDAASPLSALTITEAPPVLGVHGQLDTIVGIEQARRFLRAALMLGRTFTLVELPETDHGGPLMGAALGAHASAVDYTTADLVAAFLRNYIGPPRP